MTELLLKTPFHTWHGDHGGRLVDFAGWDMPVQYTSITEEHMAVRTGIGLFDISHMGRLQFCGPGACGFLDRLLTNDVASLECGSVRYALVCRDDGGILDDVLVYRFQDDYLLVVNASNREKIVEWITRHLGEHDVEMWDRTLEWAMVAVQGPGALEVTAAVTDCDLTAMAYYGCETASVLGHTGRVSRTGYTGEDGFELIVPAEAGPVLWECLMEGGEVTACGLGCRDTLRLEAAMPLYGHELDEQTDPYTAGLGFAVKPDACEFIGREAVMAARERVDRKRRVGLDLEGRRIGREGAEVFSGERAVGEVTSGTFSPTLERVIAMAYVEPAVSEVGTSLEVDIRGKRVAAEVVKLPFYCREV